MKRDKATQAQVDAADPHASTWLSANAGSGKTRVLTDRVARLLLSGTDPQNILCLTYTKAAASEMQNRLFKRLGAWAMMPDARLRGELQALGVEGDGPLIDLGEARKLFAAAIETPGGLKIQTIHSFCAGILRRFPLEARVSPQFREMEAHETDLLRKEVLEDMAKGEARPLVDALARHYTGDEIGRLLGEITGKQAEFANDRLEDDLAALLDTNPSDTHADIVSRILLPGDQDIVARIRDLAHASSPNDIRVARRLDRVDCSQPLGIADLPVLEGAFLTGENTKTPYSAKIDSFPVKAVRTANPDVIEQLNQLMSRIEAGRDIRLRHLAFHRSVALTRFARAFNSRYSTLKTRRGAMDFDDLITKTRTLLSDSNMAQWVLFRLDGGVDHILVDEAQDTSPEQWKVVELLTQEFTSGEGAHSDRRRTIFVVGDKKQSIYSFQGADPEGFDRMSNHFSTALNNVDSALFQRDLLFSFRSAQAILRLVDTVFQGPRLEGLGDQMRHVAFHGNMPGRVDLWPVIEKGEDDKGQWDDPLDLKSDTHHTKRLAATIAREIQRMTQEEWITVEQDGQRIRRRVTEGDVLILVRRRKDLFTALISSCKQLGLRVAGADSMILGNELAVKDIMALLAFLALPEDDLSLAAALKSPLFGWGEKALFDLAHPRPDGMTLWEALRRNESHAQTRDILQDLRDRADFLRPYDLINRVLIQHDGRRNLMRQLGPEAEDGIDALLSQALAYEQGNVPSLTGFLAWFEGEEITVKRQMEAAGDRIRIMTVHGAKGLEAPIVFLPDCGAMKRDIKSEILTTGTTPLWKATKAESPQVSAEIEEEAKRAQDRERRRLLYVAMTRAESWLIVAASGDVGKEDASWYNMVADGMQHLEAVEAVTAAGRVLRSQIGDFLAYPEVDTAPSPSAPAAVSFNNTPVATPADTRTVAPSGLKGSKVLPGETDPDNEEEALAFGRVIHLLLETLPNIPEAERPALAEQMLEAHPDAPLLPNREDIITQALAIMAAPHLSDVFTSGLAEVDVTAHIPAIGGARIHGAIDRLVIRDDHVFAIDYKSNRLIPTQSVDVPVGILRQMAVYRDALRQIYPGKEVRTAVLWTRSATLMELPDALLTDALSGVTAP